MAYVSARKFGSQRYTSMYGDKLVASDGNGDLADYSENLAADIKAPKFVTPEEFNLLVTHSAKRDIALSGITYPPDVELTIQLASNFYETYLDDTDIDRTTAIDVYVTILIELLESAEKSTYRPTEEAVAQYVIAVHEHALAA